MSDKFDKLSERFKNLKAKALKFGKQSSTTAETVKGAVKIGVETSKAAIATGKTVVDKMANKETIQQGLDVTKKGADIIAKGAKIASKGADGVANTMEKASESIKAVKDKIKP